MDLKFSFGASNPLPLANSGAGAPGPGSGPGSNVLELQVSLSVDKQALLCEGLSGDGVSYAKAQKALAQHDPATLAAALRSVLARAGAELPEPLISSVTAVVLAIGGDEAEVLSDLGLAVTPGATQIATVDDALQARTGITAGTPIRTAAKSA